MSDSSATQSKTGQESSFLEALVPIPDFFYNIKAEIEPIGGSAWVIRMLAYFLYFLTVCVLFGSFAYYSLPEQRVSLESIVNSEWQKTGFLCKPLQKTTLHGLSTDWSFDECVSATSRPSEESIVSVQKNDGSTQFDFRFAANGTLSFYDTWNAKSVETTSWHKEGFECTPLQKATIHGLSTQWSYDECVAGVSVADTANVAAVRKHHEDHFDFTFASGGVISFYDDVYASSVLQKTTQATDDWKRDGYSCYPEPPYDNTYNLKYNVSECPAAVLPPSSDTISLESVNVVAHMAVGPRFYIGAKYHPFGVGNEVYPVDVNLPTRLLVSRPGCDGHVKILDDYFYLAGGFIVKNPTCQHGAESNIALDEGIEAWQDLVSTSADGYGNFGTDVVCQKFKLNGNGFRCFDKPKPPATKELAIERYASEYPPETICAPLKQNSPFQCKPKTKPPATKELAIERYASEYPPATICAPLKLNSPFQCTRNVEVPATTRLSLSVAAAQAVFALSGIILVALLRKLSKPAETSSGDDELRSVVRKLRITVDKLDSKVDQLGTGHGEHEELIQKLLSK